MTQKAMNNVAGPKLREKDIPVFLVSSSCFTTLARMHIDERNQYLSQETIPIFEELLNLRNEYVVDFLQNSVTTDKLMELAK